MYILKNAFKNNKRNIGRNLIVGFIIFVISLSSVVAFAINESSDTVIQSAKDEYMGKVQIELDIATLRESNKRPDEVEAVTTEQYEQYAQSSYVDYTSKTYTVPTYSTEISEVTESSTASDESGEMPAGGDMPVVGEMRGATEEYAVDPTFKVIGYNDYQAMTEFVEGTYEITEGQIFENDNEIVINETLAAANDLKIGDTIELKSAYDDTKVELKITGLFADYSETVSGPFSQNAYSLTDNLIVTTTATAEEFTGGDLSKGRIEYVYYLTSSEVYDQFVAEVESIGIPEGYVASYDTMSYNMVVSPIESIVSITSGFVAVVYSVGGIILLLVTMLILRERKYEVGVLRAIGMKKSKLMMQFIMENVIIAVVALLIALPIGIGASQPISDYLLANADSSSQAEMFEGGPSMQKGNGELSTVRNGRSDASAITSMDVSVDSVVIIQIIGVVFTLIIISSLFSLTYIMRFEPINILNDSK